MMGNVRMKDIASALNISTVTVSKALSDKEGVSIELREKIKETAEAMGYRYNRLAKGMKEGKSYNIGVLIAERYTINDGDAFYLKIYQNIVKILSNRNYYGIMELVTAEDENNGTIPNVILDNKVDGIIVLGQMKSKYLENIYKTKVPLVFLDFYEEMMDVDSIISDSFYGAFTITNYLINKGHKDIGFVGNIYVTNSILDRYLGYQKALIINKIPLRDQWIISDRGEDGKYIDLVLPKGMPTAFVCNCDSVAYILINKLKKEGYKVPKDISVVGYDNDIFATLSTPKLTTIEVDTQTMAETAIASLMQKVQGEHRYLGRKVIGGNLIVRESVKEILI
ncbi:MAG TPA: LacI family transcriptional regulator [Clostridiales bacterium]|nr:LacI family transcriptional regulator [Clostridiales bacterium]